MKTALKYRAWDIQYSIMANVDLILFYSNEIYHDKNDGELKSMEHFHMMQLTPERQKDGREIYVGDILSEKWKVEVYQNNEGTFMVKFHTNFKYNLPVSLKEYLASRKKAGTAERDCIVIGNIYENPELIK
jgi:uncharacterized phage protein (TIGR01671 family)